MTLLRAWLLLACTTLFTTTTWAAEKPIPTSASSTFPQCGIDCNILNSAQDSCVAGAESTWTSCFCESSLLTSLKSSGSLCSNCGASDQSTLSSWYNSYCKSGGTTSTSNSDSDKDSNDESSTATASTSTSTATAVASASKNATTEENKSWWSTHYKWVVMLIVLVVGFTILAILGVWLKRRYEAKRPHLYAGPNASSSGALGDKSASGLMSPPQPSWAQHPVPAQPGIIPVPAPAGSDSLASSSRTDIGPKGVVPQAQTQGRLQRPPQSGG